jgi:DNA-binding winged helix-turn-helix (wHTH) protein
MLEMADAQSQPRSIRFGAFEADVRTGELRKDGLKLRFSGQPFQVLAILLERPGDVVTRDELQKRLWPDTFVDVERNLNTAVNKIREVLGDSAESPRFVETLPRRGYRFIAPVEHLGDAAGVKENPIAVPRPARTKNAVVLFWASSTFVLLAGTGWLAYQKWRTHVPQSIQRSFTRLTFDEGLQSGSTWSPDGRFIAYSSDRGGKFDIWVQQVSGGDPIQITKRPGQNIQPAWSPDGKFIAYRSEQGDGGIYMIPALGGAGLERKIAPFGYFPQWSPDSSQILFRTHFTAIGGFTWRGLMAAHPAKC